jgi:hypothetical protein
MPCAGLGQEIVVNCMVALVSGVAGAGFHCAWRARCKSQCQEGVDAGVNEDRSNSEPRV